MNTIPHRLQQGARALLVLSVFLAARGTAQIEFRQPAPGSIYKEFSRTISIFSDEWRITDPNVNLNLYPQAAPFLPNPSLDVYVDDLQGAVRAEALITMWGGHIGTTGKTISFNGNSPIPIPELGGINGIPGGTEGQCYISQVNVVVDVPLSQLVAGTNYFQGSNAGQTCYGFQWGQHGWYGLILRVYYGSGKAHATGNITSPSGGGTFGDNPVVSVSTSGGADRVDVLAYFDGYDSDGDGVSTEYHSDYHRTSGGSMDIRNHVGTAYSGPTFFVPWDNYWVPDQGGMKMIARIRNGSGVWFVSNEVTGLALARQGSSVRMYRGGTLPERAWARGDLSPVSVAVPIPSGDQVNLASAAAMHVRTWNGLDAAREPGETHYRRVNDFYDGDFGSDHYYSYDVRDVPVGQLHSGTNLIEFYSQTVAHHGIEVLWPGPALTVRWGFALPIQLAQFLWKPTAGNGVRLEWMTLSETNNYGFEVQRSSSGIADFVTLPNSFVPGHGTTIDTNRYAFVDTAPVSGRSYYRLRQMDTDGTSTTSEPLLVDRTTDVAAPPALPSAFALHQNHPNPFNPQTIIEFALPEDAVVTLKVYTLLGQLVATLVDGRQSAGQHAVTLDAHAWNSGVYICRMESGSFRESRKLVLVK